MGYELVFYFLVYFLGSCIGSFLGVCIHRIPEKRSIVHPPSTCEECGVRLKWYDMFPVFSALYLRGRCRNCGASFSLRHALVEFLVGVLYVLIVWRYGLTLQALLALYLSSVLVVCFFTDLNRRIIPNMVVLTGFVGGLFILTAMLLTGEVSLPAYLLRILYSVGPSVVLIAFGIFTDAIGAGDAKLISLFGLFFGSYALLAVGFGFVLAGVFAGVLLAIRRLDLKSALPMAPFLTLSFLFSLFVRLS